MDIKITEKNGMYQVSIICENGCEIFQDINPLNGQSITTQQKAEEIRDMLVADLNTSQNININILNDFKQSKIEEINNAYNKELSTATFISSASGNEITYTYGDTSQQKFMKLAISMVSGLLTYPVPISDIDKNVIMFNESQLVQLLKDINIYEWNLQNKLHNLINQINTATEIDTIKNINW